nr:signal peptidase II [Enorma massiliensis]
MVVGVTVACFDQIAKAVARVALSPAGTVGVQVIPGILNFELVYNEGAAFGLGEGYTLVFVTLAVIMVMASLIYLLRAPLVSSWEVVGLALVCGGAVGNAIDRVAHGVVTDFIATAFIDFPVFNIADIGITVGVVVALIGFIFLSPANLAARERAEAERIAHADSAIRRRTSRKSGRKGR